MRKFSEKYGCVALCAVVILSVVLTVVIPIALCFFAFNMPLTESVVIGSLFGFLGMSVLTFTFK